jgi:putative transposase
MDRRKRYPTDLTDAEWARIEQLIPHHMSGGANGGRPPKYDRREILNAIFYITKAGCIWRMLPHDLPPWEAVYGYFAQWRDAGVFEQINDVLRRQVRIAAGRDPQPSGAIIDSQSVKTAEKGGLTSRDRVG